MDVFERYICRVKKKGSTPTESSMNMAKQITSNQFTSSPSYNLVLVNKIETDTILYDDTKYNEKWIIFKPDTKVSIGSIVEYADKTYLMTSFFDRELDPKGELVLCNESLILSSGDEVCTVAGKDMWGDDIEECVAGDSVMIPCIVESTMYRDGTIDSINLPLGRLDVTIGYMEHDELTLNSIFEMYGEKYKIIGFDKTKQVDKIGLLVIQGEKVVV